MDITFGFEIQDYKVAFITAIELTIDKQTGGHAQFDAEIDALFSGQSNFGFANLPKIKSFGGVIPSGYGSGEAYIPALTSEATGGFYVPPPPEIGYGFLPALVSSGQIQTTSIITGSTSLPKLTSKGGDYNYGEGLAYFPKLISFGEETAVQALISLDEALFVFGGLRPQKLFLVVISESVNITHVLSGTKLYLATALESLQLDASISYLQGFIRSILETLENQDFYSAAKGEVTSSGIVFRPSIDSLAQVWVVNVDTEATTQYDNFGFNSFFTDNGIDYGVAHDGIYRLDNESDDSLNIDAIVDIGVTDLGSSEIKRLEPIYIGVSSSGTLLLQVETGQQTYTYEAIITDETLGNQKVKVGKSLAGAYFSFKLLNENGIDFDLETIRFKPVKLSRRI